MDMQDEEVAFDQVEVDKSLSMPWKWTCRECGATHVEADFSVLEVAWFEHMCGHLTSVFDQVPKASVELVVTETVEAGVKS
jgi:hypothetical protein